MGTHMVMVIVIVILIVILILRVLITDIVTVAATQTVISLLAHPIHLHTVILTFSFTNKILVIMVIIVIVNLVVIDIGITIPICDIHIVLKAAILISYGKKTNYIVYPVDNSAANTTQIIKALLMNSILINFTK